MAYSPVTNQAPQAFLESLEGKDPMESQVQQEGAASLGLLVYLDSRETEVGQKSPSPLTNTREREYSTSQVISNLTSLSQNLEQSAAHL